MRGHQPYHAEHYPLPLGFNGRWAGLYRWFSGRPLNGHRYTDATGFRYGTMSLDVSGHATAFQLWPGYKRFLVARLPAMLAPVLAIGWMLGHRLAVSMVVLGIVLAIAPSVRSAWRTRRFRGQVIEPMAAGVSAVLKVKRVTGQGHTWIEIPENFRDLDEASIRIGLPAEWIGEDGDKARLTKLVASKLNLDELSPSWSLHGASPSVSFSVPPKPPASVTFAEALADAEAAEDSAPMIGYGPRRKVELFSLLLESPHALINGGSGAGKSVLIAWLVAQFMRRGYGVLVLDAKYVSHMWLRSVPGVLYASEDEELHNALIWLDGELIRRARLVSKASDTDAASAALTPLAVILEEINTASNRLRSYWKKIKTSEDPMMSPALTALANLANMGREMRVHVFLAGQSVTAKSTGGPEGRESFGGRMLGRATANAWKMLAPQIKPAPVKRQRPGRWHIVVGDTLREFQVPFVDLKNETAKDSTAKLIEWATGGKPVPDMHEIMAAWPGVGSADQGTSEDALPTPPAGISLRQYADEVGVELKMITRWRERRSDFPVEVGYGGKPANTKLYDRDHLRAYVRERLREPATVESD
jgi:hypothetical protein